MPICPICNSNGAIKYDKITLKRMYKCGLKSKTYQKYQCGNHHIFKTENNSNLFDDSFIEYAVIIYLRSLSLNTTISILRIYYEQDILIKATLLRFIEIVADRLPSLDDIDNLFHPKRSGYLAFDGVWYKYRNINFVLLVCFDPVTFDIVSYRISDRESFQNYDLLIKSLLAKIKGDEILGLYGDGDRGLIKALKLHFKNVPIQVCVIHKEFRLGQLLPFKRVYSGKTLSKEFRLKVILFKETVEKILYAESKKRAEENFERLKKLMENEQDEKFRKAYGSLKYNFKYTLTHFDHPDMERDNNIIEGFNSIISRKLRLLKGFKKPANIDRYIKLVLLDYRFHELIESRVKQRRQFTPLNLAGVDLPPYYNFIKYLRETFNLTFS